MTTRYGEDVTVVIPAYNGERFISDSIMSVINQLNPPREIIVVDDASTDSTVLATQCIAKESAVPIRIIRRGTNSGGPAEPMNDGISAAQTEFVALLDQDDVMLPSKVGSQASVLVEHEDVDLVLSDYEHCDELGQPVGNTARDQGGELHQRFCEPGASVAFVDVAGCLNCFARKPGLPLSCSNQMFRRRMWAGVGGFSPAARSSTDHEFLFRSIRRPVAWIDKILFMKRRHHSNLWRPSFENELILLNCHYAASKELCDAAELRQFVVESSRGLAYVRRKRGEFGTAIIDCLRLVRLGRPDLALLEIGKSTVCALGRVPAARRPVC